MSCYILELSVDPGGMRKTEYHVHKTLNEIKKVLCNDLSSPTFGVYAAVWYGERILLHIIEDGELRQSIDLHPCISFKINTLPYVEFDNDNNNIYLDQNHEIIEMNDDHFFGPDYRIKQLYSNTLFCSGNVTKDQCRISRLYNRVMVRGSEVDWDTQSILDSVEYDLDTYSDNHFQINNSFFYRVDIDWSKVEIPDLRGKKLWKNKRIEFGGCELEYGPNHFE